VTSFSIEITKDTVPIIRVRGEIDVYTCSQLNQALLEAVERGNSDIILDLENTLYIDSTGLGTIAYSAKNLSERNGKINVVCPSPQIRKVFEIAGLHKKNIHFFNEEESAVKDLN
jgi:anti-anti-sigma factor